MMNVLFFHILAFFQNVRRVLRKNMCIHSKLRSLYCIVFAYIKQAEHLRIIKPLIMIHMMYIFKAIYNCNKHKPINLASKYEWHYVYTIQSYRDKESIGTIYKRI